MQEAVIDTIEGLPEILFDMFREDSEKNSSFNITLYLEYYKVSQRLSYLYIVSRARTLNE